MTKPVVLSVCGDPGGAEALAPVIGLLRSDRRVDVVSYAYNEATEVLRRYGLAYTPLTHGIDASWAGTRLSRDACSLVLAATSSNGVDLEKQFLAAARTLNVPSIAVLDFWSNYRVRFADEKGDLVYLPETIAVMDETARSDLIALDVPSDSVLVTGQPAFDALETCRRGFSPEDRTSLRSALDTKAGGLLVLFASQPLRSAYDLLGYEEESVLTDVIRSLEAVSRRGGQSIVLVVRPHPREQSTKFACYRSEQVRILVSDAGDGRECAMASDVVVGMTSVLLVEACYLGCVVVSVQPGLRTPDTLPTNRWGASRGIYRQEDILPTLEALLLDTTAREEMLERVGALTAEATAASKVVKWIYSRLTLNGS